jgi:hypothetical protein
MSDLDASEVGFEAVVHLFLLAGPEESSRAGLPVTLDKLL